MNKSNLNNNGLDNEIVNVKSNSLYARLTKLFSSDVIVRNVGGKQIKIKDTDNIMYATDRNSYRDRFNRIRSTGYNAYTRDFALSYQSARMDLFRDYDVMDSDPIISSALDIYADECLSNNEYGKILTVDSPNNNIKQILENLFFDILNVDHYLWSWTRNMCKYGDFFLKLYVTPSYGVYMVEPISAYNVERIENSDPTNKRYVKFQLRPTDTSQAEILEQYEIAHFRLVSDSNFIPYGKSVIEGARRIWKQLSLMEDAMLIHRIMRAPEKRIFYTDIGNIAPNEVDAFMQKQRDMMRKVPYIDPNTGEYNLRFNLQNMVEDYLIAVRGGDSGTRIDTLGGMDWTGTEDIEYLRNKLMAALKIPKAFLGYDENTSGKATLASEDVRFAKTIQRIQNILCSELDKIAIVHLYSQGYRDESLVNFKLTLTNPSSIFEKEKIDILSNRVDLATNILDNKILSKDWIYKNIFKMSTDDIAVIKQEIIEDTKQKYRFNAIENEGHDPAKPFKKISGGDGEGDSEGGPMGGSSGGGSGGGGLKGIGGMGDDSGMEDMGDIGDIGSPDEAGEAGGETEKGGAKSSPEDKITSKIKNLDDLEGGSDEESDTEKNTDSEEEDVLKEEEERDQSGEKDARDYPFGEDPLGDKELHKKTNKNSEFKKKSEISHNYENETPLYENAHKKYTNFIKSLSFLDKETPDDIKKELLK